MAVTKADVLRIAPELASLTSYSDADWDAFIADASSQVNPTYWGARADLGVKYLTAHLIAIGNPQAGGRLVASRTVGPVSESYATPQMDQSSLGATRFGAEFKRLRRSLGQRFLVP